MRRRTRRFAISAAAAPPILAIAAALAVGGSAGGCTHGGAPSPAPTATPASFEGTWKWICCDGKYSGTLALSQDGSTLAGSMEGGLEGVAAEVHGSVDGSRASLVRGKPGSEQRYRVQVDGTGEAMAGSFDGFHDAMAGTDFKARRVSRHRPAQPAETVHER